MGDLYLLGDAVGEDFLARVKPESPVLVFKFKLSLVLKSEFRDEQQLSLVSVLNNTPVDVEVFNLSKNSNAE